MKNVILFISLISICRSYSQTATYLSAFGGSGLDYGSSITVLQNGYVVAGYTSSFGSQSYDFYISKLDFNGNLLWSKKAGGPQADLLYSITPTSDGNFVLAGYSNSFTDIVLAGYNIILIKMDSMGTIQWTNKYGGSADECGFVIKEAKNKDLLIGGYTNSFGSGGQDGTVMRVDSMGVLKWMKAYGTSATEIFNALVETDNGDIVVTGSQAQNSAKQIIGLKLDSAGNIKWQKLFDIDGSTFNNPYSRWGNDVICLSDKNLLFAGTLGNGYVGNGAPFLMKTDTAGNVLYAHEYAFNSGVCGANRVIQTASGFCVYAYMNQEPVLFGTNAAGTTLWDYNYSIPTTYFINGTAGDLKATPAGGFVIASNVMNNSNRDVSVIQTSASGSTPCGNGNPTYSGGSMNSATVAVSPLLFATVAGGSGASVVLKDSLVSSTLSAQCNTASVNLRSFSTSRVYPNPCENWLFVDAENYMDISGIEISDIFGNSKMCVAGNGATKKINVSDLWGGVYFYKIYFSSGKPETGKFLVQH